MISNKFEIYLDYLTNSGYFPVKTESCWWFNAYHQKRVYFSLPLHRQITPSELEIRRFFQKEPQAWAVRFISPIEGSFGIRSYQWVYRPPYLIENLSSNNRSKIRRGLRRCTVRKVSFRTLAESGQQARQDTLSRHDQKQDCDSGIDLSMADCSNFEAWGAFVGDELAAYLITLWVEEWAHLLVNRSSDQHLRHYPNNALIFYAVRELLSRSDCSAISYGWEPLEPHQSLDHFKSGMGAVQEPVRQCVLLRPALRVFLRPVICRGLAALARLFPANSRMQKAAGLFTLAAAGARAYKG